jgi:micrococcal nuclease
MYDPSNQFLGYKKIDLKQFQLYINNNYIMKLSRFCCFAIPCTKMFISKENDPGINFDRIINWDDTVPFVMPLTGGRVIKVYDGDTITIASKLPFPDSPLYRFSVRLSGINCPEIKGMSIQEIACAKDARDAMIEMINQKDVTLKNVANEKYGRVLADVYLGDLHLNQWMIDQRFAVAYDGGTKKVPDSWAKYRLTGENNF